MSWRRLQGQQMFAGMWLFGWELLSICDHRGKFGGDSHCDHGDLIFLICHVLSRYHLPKGWTHLTVSLQLAKFGDHWSSASVDITYLICHVTSQDHVIEGSFHFMGGSSSIYVTTLQSLVAVGTVDIMILVWHMISKGHVIKGSCEFIERSRSK